MKNFKRILCSIMMLCILASMLPVSSIAADTPKCGEKGAETFFNGSALGHAESDWKCDDENHRKECTAEGCAAIIEGSQAPHDDTDNDNKCDTCGHEIDDPPTSDSAITVIAITAICAATTFAFVVFKKRYAR